MNQRKLMLLILNSFTDSMSEHDRWYKALPWYRRAWITFWDRIPGIALTALYVIFFACLAAALTANVVDLFCLLGRTS